MPDNEQAEKTTREQDLIARVKKHVKECIDRESELRAKCLDDLEFLSASPDEPEKQWGSRAIAERFREGRPALVVNRLDQFVQHITNQQRQNRVSAKVFPVDSNGDPETAEIIQGMIRNVEYQSRADIARDTAEFYAVAMGFGFYELTTDYANPFTIDQEIKVVRVKNPFQVYLGPHDMPDGSDAEYGFKFTDLTKEEYEAEYGNAENVSSFDDVLGIGDTDWCEENKIRICEYRYVDYQDDTVLKLKDGSEVLASKVPKGKKLRVVDKRPTRIPTYKWVKLTASDVLDETELPFNGIGIIKVTGNELTVNGKTILKGIVRGMKDAQRQYNFMLTAETEAAADNDPPVVVDGQDEGHEEEWATRNRKRPSVLHVQGKSINGQPAPNPSRLGPDMTIAAKSQARMMAAEDLKALTGIYDAALGNKSNENSGRAILSRQQQSDVANFHFQDNLTRSITYECRMIVDAIPVVYSGPRVVRTIGEDDSQKLVKINQLFAEGNKQKQYDLTVGKYDVICTAGPSFATKRQEGAATMVDLARTAPVVMNAAPDLVVKCLDIPYAQEISERLKKTLPPQLQDKQEGQPEIPPEVQQQMAQHQQMVDALTQELQQATEEITGLKRGDQVRLAQIESNERMENKRLEVQLAIAEINSKAQDELTRAKLEADLETKLRVQENQHAHEAAMRSAEAGHEEIMANAAHERGLELANQGGNSGEEGSQDA